MARLIGYTALTSLDGCVLAAAAALVFTACSGTAPASTATAAPGIDVLATLEKRAYEARKSKDAKFWDTFLSDAFIGYGASGKLDKASATKEYTGADCEIRSYALSDVQMTPLGTDVALITFTATVDGTCSGQKVPANSRAASVYVRDGEKWKGAFHAEARVLDPGTVPATPVGERKEPEQAEVDPAARDAGTDAMLAVEKAVWEAWRAHDGNKLEVLTASDISFINIFGTFFATKGDALNDWTAAGCDVQRVSVTNAAGKMLSPTVGILTFTGAADGACYGQKVGPIWGTSVYVKHGDVWKWTFGINVPAPSEGA